MGKSIISKWFTLIGIGAITTIFVVVGVAVAEPGIVKVTPNLRMPDLAGRPDTDLVEFSGGGRMSVKTLRQMEAIAPKLRAPGSYRVPAALKSKPAAKGTRIKNATDLSAALKRSDNETVQLPSGRLTTVGQIKFVLPKVEQQIGHSLSKIPKRPNLSGLAVKITPGTTEEEWKQILQKPDSTVLESPNGTRITVGELKAALRTSPPSERRN